MAFGERLRFFRTMRGMTQRLLGLTMGFPEKSADLRVAQYENGSRHPKYEVIEQFASVLDISPKALDLPDIDTNIGLLHTLFALEDLYGLRVVTVEGEPFLFVDKTHNKNAAKLHQMLLAWSEQAAKLTAGEITKEEYDNWRYCYPKYDTTQSCENIPSEKTTDALLKAFKKQLRNTQK